MVLEFSALTRSNRGMCVSPLIVASLMLLIVLAGCAGTQRPSEPPMTRPAVIPPPQTRPVFRELGRSTQGRAIELHEFPVVAVAPARPVLIFAAIHGDEPTTEFVARRLIEHLHAHPAETPVIVIPAINPDGLAARSRTNSRGVDLNRNFPAANWKSTRRGAYYNGPSPASEVETRLLMKLIEELNPRRIVAMHSITRGRQCNNYDGPAKDLAERMSKHNGYPARATIGYPTPGSFGSYAGIDRQIPVITLELPRDLAGQAAWEQNREALLEALREP